MWQATDGSRFALMLGATVHPFQGWRSSQGFVLFAACRLMSTGKSIARVSTISPRPSSLVSRSARFCGRERWNHMRWKPSVGKLSLSFVGISSSREPVRGSANEHLYNPTENSSGLGAGPPRAESDD